MATSQNGWAVFTSAPSGNLKWITGRVRPGDVMVIFNDLCQRFHAEVEKITVGHSWGWAYRAIRGKTSGFSNHASGTAIDLNAPKHPIGKRNTFTSAQQSKIRAIIRLYDGVIRWGGDYKGRPDDMHFEINASAAAVKRVADKIRAGGGNSGATPAPPKRPTGKVPGPGYDFPLPAGAYFGPKSGPDRSYSGFHNRKVKGRTDRQWLQEFATQLSRRGWNVGKGRTYLTRAGNDGKYGAEYAALIRAFQRSQGLDQDSLLGKATWDEAFKAPVT
jgi:hypothetical protein